MRVQPRKFGDGTKGVCLIAETTLESELLDEYLGDCGREDIVVSGTLKLSGDVSTHYVWLQTVDREAPQ